MRVDGVRGAPVIPVVAAAGAQMRQLRDLFVDAGGLAGNIVWKGRILEYLS